MFNSSIPSTEAMRKLRRLLGGPQHTSASHHSCWCWVDVPLWHAGALDRQTSLGLAVLGIPGFKMYPGGEGAAGLTTRASFYALPIPETYLGYSIGVVNQGEEGIESAARLLTFRARLGQCTWKLHTAEFCACRGFPFKPGELPQAQPAEGGASPPLHRLWVRRRTERCGLSLAARPHILLLTVSTCPHGFVLTHAVGAVGACADTMLITSLQIHQGTMCFATAKPHETCSPRRGPAGPRPGSSGVDLHFQSTVHGQRCRQQQEADGFHAGRRDPLVEHETRPCEDLVSCIELCLNCAQVSRCRHADGQRRPEQLAEAGRRGSGAGSRHPGHPQHQ